MSGSIDLQPEHFEIAREILRRHLPSSARLWAFGSRVTGRARKYSDLDVAIDAGCRLDLALLLAVAEDLEESDLPYKVDVVDLQAIDERFRALVDREKIPLALAGKPVASGKGP